VRTPGAEAQTVGQKFVAAAQRPEGEMGQTRPHFRPSGQSLGRRRPHRTVALHRMGRRALGHRTLRPAKRPQRMAQPRQQPKVRGCGQGDEGVAEAKGEKPNSLTSTIDC